MNPHNNVEVQLAACLMAAEGSRETTIEKVPHEAFADSLALRRVRDLRAVYDAVTEDSARWIREDGGENKLAVAIANVKGWTG